MPRLNLDMEKFEHTLREIADFLNQCSQGQKAYLSNLVSRLGPVLKGVKPAELVNIDQCPEIISAWCRLEHLLYSKAKDYGVRKIREIRGRSQVLVYHQTSLEHSLSQHEVALWILRSLNYPEVYCMEEYVNCLTKRLQSESFPHEIGLFLGYPVKDVLGFMGYMPFKYIKTKGWRVYGSERLSDLRYTDYLEAKAEATRLLNFWVYH